MARKFWEKVGGNRIQFYNEPEEVLKDSALERIAEINEILSAPDHIKEFIAQANPALETEQQFADLFEDERAELAERLDYWDMDTVTDTIDVVSSGWFKPANGQLGPAVALGVSNDETGFEAALGLDGVIANTWRSDLDPLADPANPVPHEIVVDLGYKRRLEGIRIHQGAAPGNRLQYTGLEVAVASGVSGLTNNPAAVVATGVDLSANPADGTWGLVQFTAPRTGRYIAIRILETGHASNFLTFRDFELHQHPRTFGL